MSEQLKSENILLDLLVNKKWRVVRHIAMIVILAINFYPDINPVVIKKLQIPNADLIVKDIKNATIVMFFISVALLYTNLLILVPRLLFKNRYIYYFISCMLLGVLYFFTEYVASRYFLKAIPDYLPTVEFSLKGFIDSALVPLIFLCATAGYKIFKKWITDNKLLSEMKEAKIREELTNLKNQINPHFLFNTLNNLNTLITTDPAKATAVVLGLSDVLRYQLYEANADKVMLKKDIDILSQLLELEKIRRDNFQFSITVEGEMNGLLIHPFIFISFVENAIKHSADSKAFSYIAVDFTVTRDRLNFSCKNSKPVLPPTSKIGGLGLQNIKRRLQLLYPGTNILEIKDDVRKYIVNLKLHL
jgi:sensor histidine kinase YesM